MGLSQLRNEQRPRKRGYFFAAISEQVAAMNITQGPLMSIRKDIPWSVEPSTLDIIVAAICGTPDGLAPVGTGDDAFLYRLPEEACSWLNRLLPEHPQSALAEIESMADRLMQNPAVASNFKRTGIIGLLLGLRTHALRAVKGDEKRSLYYWFTPHSKHLVATLHRLAGTSPT